MLRGLTVASAELVSRHLTAAQVGSGHADDKSDLMEKKPFQKIEPDDIPDDIWIY